MNLRDLRYLIAIADALHFRRAAEAARVSQPTLSGQLRKLEALLGITLFERDSRNVVLTPAGEAVVAEARLVLAHAAAIGDIAGAHRDPLTGGFRLGIIASLGPFLGPDLLGRLQHDAPNLRISLHESLTDDLLAALRARTLDAAVLATPATGEDLTAIPLFDEPFLLAHAPDHKLAAIAAPVLADIERGTLLLLAEGHCLRDQALSLCGGDSVNEQVKATSLLTLMRLAALGRGVTLVPALAGGFASGLVLRPLPDGEAHRGVHLLARRSFPRIAVLRVTAAACRAIAATHGLAAA